MRDQEHSAGHREREHRQARRSSDRWPPGPRTPSRPAAKFSRWTIVGATSEDRREQRSTAARRGRRPARSCSTVPNRWLKGATSRKAKRTCTPGSATRARPADRSGCGQAFGLGLVAKPLRVLGAIELDRGRGCSITVSLARQESPTPPRARQTGQRSPPRCLTGSRSARTSRAADGPPAAGSAGRRGVPRRCSARAAARAARRSR